MADKARISQLSMRIDKLQQDTKPATPAAEASKAFESLLDRYRTGDEGDINTRNAHRLALSVKPSWRGTVVELHDLVVERILEQLQDAANPPNPSGQPDTPGQRYAKAVMASEIQDRFMDKLASDPDLQNTVAQMMAALDDQCPGRARRLVAPAGVAVPPPDFMP
jgi:hypothetical protein